MRETYEQCPNWAGQGIYLRYDSYHDTYYVGMTTKMEERYKDEQCDPYQFEVTVLFVPVEGDVKALHEAELEAIDFLSTWLPEGKLRNIRDNPYAANFLRRRTLFVGPTTPCGPIVPPSLARAHQAVVTAEE